MERVNGFVVKVAIECRERLTVRGDEIGSTHAVRSGASENRLSHEKGEKDHT
jgi:hypothetical protein